MKYLMIAILLLSPSAFAQSVTSMSGDSGTVATMSGPVYDGRCESTVAKYNGQWRDFSTVPRDGTVVEILNTYGVAPTYGIFKWVPYGKDTFASDGSTGRWEDSTDPHTGLGESGCNYWRPYKKVGKYVDPTHGAQKSVKYWCDAMGVGYDRKKDACR